MAIPSKLVGAKAMRRHIIDVPFGLVFSPSAMDLIAGEVHVADKGEGQRPAKSVFAVPLQPYRIVADRGAERGKAGVRVALDALSSAPASVQLRRIDADEAHPFFATSQRVAIGGDAGNRRRRKGN